MGLHDNWKVITDHHSTPRNLLHLPKRKDFTTTVSPLGGARANDEAESFMKLLNKTEKIAHLQGRNSKIAIQEMLTGFRSTPHPATGTTPYEALMNRPVRTKLDH